MVEDGTQTTHVVNPLMVHVLLQGSEREEGGTCRRGSLQQTNNHQQVSRDEITYSVKLLRDKTFVDW